MVRKIQLIYKLKIAKDDFLLFLEISNGYHVRKFVNKHVRKPQMRKPLFIGIKALIRLTKECIPFVIYAAPTSENKTSTTNIWILKMCFWRRMSTDFWSTVHIIVQLIWKISTTTFWPDLRPIANIVGIITEVYWRGSGQELHSLLQVTT